MRLIPIDRNEIPCINGYKTTKNLEILNEFTKIDAKAVRVDNNYGSKAASAASALNQSAKRFGMMGIKAIARRPYVYLVKED